jgi:predicted dehydrogenase
VMDETVRVGLVGLGRIGCVHAANLAGRTPGARLVRMVDADEDPGLGGGDAAAATVLARAAERCFREGRTVWLKRSSTRRRISAVNTDRRAGVVG